MTLLDFIDKIAQRALQYPHVFLKPGHNGPYFHPETELRNKGHWLITFCKLYEWTGREAYKSKAAEFAEYIVSKDARPYGYSFYHRNTLKKDRCNGLVGQAWTFEALAQAAETFQNNTFNKLAEEVFLQHHFNTKYALWNILEIDGEILPIDNAFNHQLWFAAGISMVNSHNTEIHSQISSFLEKLFDNVTILENGLIYHEFDFEIQDAYGKNAKLSFRKRIKQQIKQILSGTGRNKVTDITSLTPVEKKEWLWKKMKHKSIGYHAFNMYAFALLKQRYPEHPVWNNPLFKKTVDYLFSEEYNQGINNNEYSFAYNPPGYEVPFSVAVLQPPEQEQLHSFAQSWVNRQIEICFNPETYLFDRNNVDPSTLTARLYEVTRLEYAILKKINIL